MLKNRRTRLWRIFCFVGWGSAVAKVSASRRVRAFAIAERRVGQKM